jgi:DNA-binding IclR family transcriptional regulator
MREEPMSGVLERTLGILELLSGHPAGLPVGTIAAELAMPPSAAHRLLNDLVRAGYVRQDRAQGDYALTIKLAAMGLSFLGQSGVNDIAQPILDRLAAESGELVRLSVIDGRRLVWVAVAQGATSGLRYDPGREQGLVVHLASTAGGQAWLATMSDEEALMRVAEQGFVPEAQTPGPGAPTSAPRLLEALKQARTLGYSVSVDSYIVGMAAMAMPVRADADGRVIGVLSVAGPAARMTPQRMAALAEPLAGAAADLGRASRGSRLFPAATERNTERSDP